MFDESGSVVTVFNGEIYNYRELRRDLQVAGHVFRGSSDTEVLLRGYLEFGCEVLDRLNGIFAFAIYDGRDRTLFLARDHLGVKPLYFAESPRGLLFASEIKAILQEPSVSRELDFDSVLRYLVFQWSPGSGTPLQAVRKLAPGHAMLVRDRRITRTWRYFRPVIREAAESRPVGELSEELISVFREAVRRQMVADVPVGAFLSGGLDSSAVVTFAKEFAAGGTLDCFTIAPRGAGFRAEGVADDLPYAKQVAAHLGVRLHTVDVDSRIIERLPRVLYHLDEPQADPAAINVMIIAELAKSHGIKVLMSGSAGDDLFSGYRRHVALVAERYWTCLPQGLRRLTAAVARSLPQNRPALRRFSKAFRYAGLDGDARLFSYFFWFDPAALPDLFVRDVRSLVRGIDGPLSAELDATAVHTKGLNRMLLIEQNFFLPDHNLNYTDKLSMAAGVETRVPFLDRDLVAFANSLPAAVKQVRGEGKWIFKKAMEPFLPRSVIYRPKTGFGAPLRSWLRNELRDTVDEYLSRTSTVSRGLFKDSAVRRLIELDRAGRIDASYTIFSLLSMELWLRTFVDPPSPRPVS